MEDKRCYGTTKGRPCKVMPRDNHFYCWRHKNLEADLTKDADKLRKQIMQMCIRRMPFTEKFSKKACSYAACVNHRLVLPVAKAYPMGDYNCVARALRFDITLSRFITRTRDGDILAYESSKYPGGVYVTDPHGEGSRPQSGIIPTYVHRVHVPAKSCVIIMVPQMSKIHKYELIVGTSLYPTKVARHQVYFQTISFEVNFTGNFPAIEYKTRRPYICRIPCTISGSMFRVNDMRVIRACFISVFCQCPRWR